MATSALHATPQANASGVLSNSVTIPATTAGSILCVVIGQAAGGTAVLPTVSDAAAVATWVNPAALTATDGPPPVDSQSGVNSSIVVAYAINVPAGITTINIAWAATSKANYVQVIEIGGADTSGTAVRVSVHGGGGTAATTQTPPSMTGVLTGDFVIFAEQAPATAVPTGSAGYTMATGSEGGSNWLAVAYQVAAAGGTFSNTFSNTASVKAGMIGITFKIAAGGGGGAPVMTAPPTISGVAQSGQTLTVGSNGTWTNTPTSFSYAWRYTDPDNGGVFTLSTTSSCVIPSILGFWGIPVTLTVTATNASGSGTASVDSSSVTYATGGSVPTLFAGTSAKITAPSLYVAPVGDPSNTATITPASWSSGTSSQSTFGFERSFDGGATWSPAQPQSTHSVMSFSDADVGALIRGYNISVNYYGPSLPAYTPVIGPITTRPFTANVGIQMPTFSFLIQFASSTYASVEDFVRHSIQLRRGRQNALDKVEAGTCTFTLDNSGRQFEPEYAASPYYPNIVPMRILQVAVSVGAVSTTLFIGVIPAWPMNWPDVKRNEITVTAVDWFLVLNGQKATHLFPTNVSSAQINAVLGFAAGGIGTVSQVLDTGQETNLGIDAKAVPLLDLVQTITDSENGVFFCRSDGALTFHSRDHRITAANSTTTQATFGDDPTQGEIPYIGGIDTEFGISRLFNDVEITSGLASPTMTPVTDATSIAAYGTQTYSKTTILSTDAASQAQATRILSQNKDPHLRFPTLKVDLLRDDGVLQTVLGLEVSDLVVVNRRPYTGGTPISKACWVEGIQHDISFDPPRWITTLSLSLAQNYSGSGPSAYWRLDPTSGSDSLDSTTILR